jgi:hypothetical protein
MRSWLALFVLITNLGFFQPMALGSGSVEINELEASYHFGEEITFHAQITPLDHVTEVYLFLQPTGDQTRTEKIVPGSNGQINFIYDLVQKPIRPFTKITYWLQIMLDKGSPISSDKLSFDYEDNRFVWQQLDGGNFQVRWIKGDVVFGQAILNAAQRGLRSAASILPGALPVPTKIYVYPNATDLQGASLDHQSWAAGHAMVDLGTISISIAPGAEQEIELDRQIPHELMHILTYQAAGDSYQRLPVWFTEGTASLAETTPNPDYQSALNQAVASRTLIPFASLCNAFPSDASGAFLSYAQSASFIRFIREKYGTPALQKMITGYQNGLGCEDGVNAALGSSLEQLDHRWQQETQGVDTGSLAIQNLSPYLISGLLLIFLPVGFGLSSRRKAKNTVPSRETAK